MTVAALDTTGDVPEFSLVQGGPVYGLARRLSAFGRPLGQVGFGVGLALIAWVPLLGLAALEGLRPGEGTTVSFLASINTHVRFLVAIPLAFGLVLLHLLLYLGPLLCFGPRLLAVKRRGLREYGAVATAYVQGFDAKWLRGGAPPGESLLGSGDIQSLNDLAGGFDVIRRMRVLPFGPGLVLILVVATLLPMAPLLFLAFPLDELLALAAKLVLGG